MKKLDSVFNVGDIITFKTHPMFFDYIIKGDSKFVPPIMIIKEVLFENLKKISDDLNGKQISERIKYVCTYFDDNKSIFIDVHLYETMIRSFEYLKFGQISKNDEIIINSEDFVNEIKSYRKPEYEFGKIIVFKTKKIEIFKLRSSKKIILDPEASNKVIKAKEILQYVVNYATPDFIISGFKEEKQIGLKYEDGSQKRLASTNFIKIKWYNPSQQKFSEQFLPEEFFIDKKSI